MTDEQIEQCWREHHPHLCRFVGNILSRRAHPVVGIETEDIVSTVFMRFIQHGQYQFHGESSIRTYLCTCAMNEVRSLLRRKANKARSKQIPVEDMVAYLRDPVPSIEALTIQRDTAKQQIRKHWKGSERILYLIADGHNQLEVAKATGLTVLTIKMRLFRTRKRSQHK